MEWDKEAEKTLINMMKKRLRSSNTDKNKE